MAIGVAIGHFIPSSARLRQPLSDADNKHPDRYRAHHYDVSPLAKVRYEKLREVFRNKRVLGLSLDSLANDLVGSHRGRAIVSSAADLKKIGDAPVAVLVLDELNSRFEDMGFSRQMMVKYLEAQPAVLQEPMVLMVAMNNSFQQIHDYTQNRDELIEAVKKHMPEFAWRMVNSGKSGPGAVERMAQVMAAL
jgi:hypothetical protein